MKEPLQLLAALPAVWTYLEGREFDMACAAAQIALGALQYNRDGWSLVLERYNPHISAQAGRLLCSFLCNSRLLLLPALALTFAG